MSLRRCKGRERFPQDLVSFLFPSIFQVLRSSFSKLLCRRTSPPKPPRMGFYDICRAFILCITTFFPIQFLQHNDSQQAIFSHGGYDAAQYGPKFPAPNGPDTPGINFICKYPDLGDDWKSCSTPENRQCWLKSSTGGIFDIETDYENYYPQGVLREASRRHHYNP